MIDYYQELVKEQNKKIIALQKADDFYAIGRIASFIFLLIAAFKLFETGSILWIVLTAAALTSFILVLIFNFRNNDNLKDNSIKRDIYLNEIKVLSFLGNDYYPGSDFINPEHDYTSDMDVFGDRSLFSYINRCSTGVGNMALAKALSEKTSRDETLQLQEAVKELTEKSHWAIGVRTSLFEKKIKDFQKEYLPHISPIHENTKKYKRWLYSYYIILGFTLGGIIVLSNLSLLLLPIIAGTIFYRITGRYIKSIKVQLAGREKIINEYKKFLEQFETQQWQSPYLNNLQTKLKTGKTTACGAIASLGDLSQKLDYTLNLIMLFVLNYIFFWDLLMSIKIHAWFHKYAEKTTEWFEVIGRVEAIISLACLRNNHPEWIFPVIRNDNFLIVGKELGHPLIAKPQRITNDFDCPNPKIVSVVTGSNMAGKSTFLRTLGTNIILARAGAPVCAAELVLGDFRIMTYLNITDSLSENTSTFYREIKRLKKLLDSARNDNNVLLLLDELLRGTNSADKARGSMAITRDLIRHNIPAVIATHNLELADMKQQYPGNIENYYFDITIENNEHMIFDYKLKPGVCNTFNASLLLKKIGIDISQ